MPTNAQYEAMRLDIACLTRENEELRGKLVAAEAHESTLASLCDWINTHCRECGVAEADWYTLPMMRDAIDRIVFAQRKREHYLRTQLSAAEARCYAAERAAQRMTTSNDAGFERVEQMIQQTDGLQAQLSAAEARYVGGACHILSGKCDCTLCKQDAKIAELSGKIGELEAQLAAAEAERALSGSVTESLLRAERDEAMRQVISAESLFREALSRRPVDWVDWMERVEKWVNK